MTNINNLFFELIRVAIGTQDTLSRPPSKGEWAELYAMAKKQSLVGICFSAVQKLTNNQEPITQNLDEVQYLTWMGMAAKIQQRNEVVNAQCVDVQQIIGKAGFRTFIMKGQGNAAMYNNDLKLLRQSGDIDIYLEGGFEKVNAFVQRTCSTKEVNRLEIQYRILEDTEVEIHYKPFYMPNPKDDKVLLQFFALEAEKCFGNKISLPNAVEISVGTTAFNLVHQMVHIWHHFMTEGVGLRQLMDYYFVVLAADNEVPKVQEVVKLLEMERFAGGVMSVIQTVFGLEEHKLLWQPDPEAGTWILSEVMQKGNFGHLSDDNLMKRLPLERLWIKTKFAIRYRVFGHAAWFWIPVRSMADRVWQWRHRFE